MASRTIKGITIEFGADTTELLRSFSKLKHESTQMARSLKDMNNLMKFNPKNVELMTQKQQELKKQIESTSERLKVLNNMQGELKAKGVDENSDEFKALRREIIETEGVLNSYKKQLKRVDEQLNISNTKLGQFGEGLRKSGKALQEKGKNIQEFGSGLKNIGDNLTTKVSLPLIGLGTAASKAAIDFESAFAGVRKTVDATEEEYSKLSDGIKQMSKEIPASASAISEVTEAAGQLGIQKEHLLSFTRVMIDLGEATNLTADQGATQLARFANITRMSQRDFDRLGSTIVALGNNFATTEAEIVAMGMRLAGAGNQIGLTESEIMGFATALSSVGIEAEAGGSAFSKLMINMGVASEVGSNANKVIKSTGYSLRDLQMMASHDSDSFGALASKLSLTKAELKKMVNASATLEGFSKVTGMSSEQFKKAFAEDATGAIQLFIEGLKNADKKGQSAIAILDDMGIKEVRLRDTILRATGATELFTDAVKLGSEAWEENNALTKEAEQRYATTESKIQIAKNKLVELGIGLGEQLLPSVIRLIEKGEGLVEWLDGLDKGTKDNIIQMAAFAIAVGPVLSITGRLTQGFGSLVTFSGKVAEGVGSLATRIAAAGGLKAAFTGAMTSVGAFGTKLLAFATGPVGIAIAAIAAIGAGIYAFTQNKEVIMDFVSRTGESIKNWATNAKDTVTEKFNGIKESISGAWDGLKESASTKWNEITTSVTGKIDEMKTGMSAKWEEVKTGTTTKWEEIKSSVSGKVEEIKTTVSDKWQGITTSISETWTGIKDGVVTGWTNIKNTLQPYVDGAIKIINVPFSFLSATFEGIWLGIKAGAEIAWHVISTKAKEYWGKIKENIIAPVQEAWTNVVEKANQIKQALSEKWEAIKTAATEKWNAVKESISKPVQEAWSRVTEKANQIKNSVTEKWEAVKNATVEKWNAIKESVTTKFESAKTAVSDKANQIKNNVTEKWNTVKNVTTERWNAIKNSIVTKFESAKSSVTDKATQIRNNVTDKFNATKSSALGIWENIKSSVGSKVESIRSNVASKFEAARSAIVGPLERARDKVKSIIDRIKGFFSNLSLKLPKFELPKMPSFGLKRKTVTVMGKEFTIPAGFSIKWNREGGIFRKPTVLADAYGGLQGVGEPSTGGEAILPLNRLPELMAEAIEKAKVQTKNVIVNYVTLDGKVIATEVTEQVNDNLGIKVSRSRLAGGLT